MTTNEIIETLNSRIADLDAELATERDTAIRQTLIHRLISLYNARNGLPLHTGRAA